MNVPADAGLSFPFRVDARGTLATTRDRAELVRDAIVDIIETHPGEVQTMPHYGVRDYTFGMVNEGFRRRLIHQMLTQISYYVPDARDVEVTVEAGDPQQVEVLVTYGIRDGATASLVYPLWRLRQS